MNEGIIKKFTQVVALGAEIPPGGRLVLVNGSPAGPQYSIFLQNDFQVLSAGETRIKQLLGRNDIVVDVVDQLDPETAADANTLILELERATMRVYRASGTSGSLRR